LKCIILSNQIRQNDSSSKAGFFIENLFKDKLSPAFLYHNYKHTQEVVANAEILANADNLNDEEKKYYWLHVGFTTVAIQKILCCMKKKAVRLQQNFLKRRGKRGLYPESKGTYYVHKICCKPDNRIENIIRDADSSHLASEDYFTYSDNLRKEWEQTLGKTSVKRNGI
jgi:hypothetical protein